MTWTTSSSTRGHCFTPTEIQCATSRRLPAPWNNIVNLCSTSTSRGGEVIGAARALLLKSTVRMQLPPTDAPIFLVGFMATGKTTVGGILAGRLGWTMLDIDDLVTAEAGMTVRDIFA